MSLHAVFFVLDCLAMFAALVLGGGLLTSQPHSVSARLTALMLLNAALYVAFQRVMFTGWIPAPYQFDLNGVFLLIPQVLMNTTPGVFMYLCFFLFQEPGTRFPRVLTGLFVLETALEDLLPYLLGITTHPSMTIHRHRRERGVCTSSSKCCRPVLQTVFVGCAMYWTVKDWRADLVELRRFLRMLVIAVFGINIVSITLLTRVVLANDDIRDALRRTRPTTAFHVADATAFIVWLWNPMRSMPAVHRGDAGRRRRPTRRWTSTMPRSRPRWSSASIRNRESDIASLAALLKMPEYRLRRLINVKLGYRNFNQMLHAYRVADAAAALADPEKRHLPILTIALTAGYQSINPFNRAFKESKGVTPSAFRAQAQRSNGRSE